MIFDDFLHYNLKSPLLAGDFSFLIQFQIQINNGYKKFIGL